MAEGVYHEGAAPPAAFIWERVKKHNKDLYEGNGKPALTVRIETAEKCNEDHEKRLSKLERNFAWSITLLITILVTLLADIGKSAIFHIQ